MKIYSMTATFGKLEKETLTLKPGFNSIYAPNEWGKTTWCAFLTAMLYGLDTRAKSTKTALADKERYAPWSGSPMSGRVDLHWKGRDITIERTTKGRIPLGKFRAYETESGLEVTELDAANCGQMLLGVERSVFVRSAFIRLSDLPVTQDEALRRRLNALVSTGDENSAGDRLAKGLKELKNKCRYNKTGLIPQAEEERRALEEKLEEIESLQQHSQRLQIRLEQLGQSLELLENHRDALAYAAAQADEQHVAKAKALRDELRDKLTQLDGACAGLPEREQVQWALDQLNRLDQAMQTLNMEMQLLAEEIPQPQPPEFLTDASPEAALETVREQSARYRKLIRHNPVWMILGILLMICGGVAAGWYLLPGLMGAGIGAVMLVAAWADKTRRQREAAALREIYRSDDPDSWLAEAAAYRTAVAQVREREAKQRAAQAELNARREELADKIRHMTQGKGLEACRTDWEAALDAWDALADASRDLHRAEHQLRTLESMARTAQPPKRPDEMTCTQQETDRRLSDGYTERRQLEARLGQYAGRMEVLGDPEQLRKQLNGVNSRLHKLEETYGALTLAQDTLTRATQELQRRFAPRIAKRACALMSRMTGGRYDRLQLAEDFSLLAGAEQENVLHDALWRSDGTADQLYLALRLAVAEELAPEVPLILDDALVRFDDDRLKAALEILREESQTKQVILFSCQSREAETS